MLKALRKTVRTEGFMLIELTIAVSVLSVGVLGMGLALDTSRKLSLVSERHAAMTHIAQREIERVEGLPYAQVGQPQAPGPHSSDPDNPDYYLVNGSPPSFQWDRTAGSAEQVDVDSSGQITPVQNWSEGGFSGQVYDFVTWSQDAKCAPGCPSSQNYKRITVAVTMGGGLQPYPVFVSSIVADPQSVPQGGISNGQTGNPLTDPSTYCNDANGNKVLCTSPIDDGNPNTWFFHDCPATNSSCSLPTGDHTLHDTVGTATNGVCTTSQSLATIASNIVGCPVPDLMDSNPPGNTGGGSGCENSAFSPALCNYSQDLCDNSCNPTGGRVVTPTCSNNSGCGTGSTNDCSNGAFSNNLANAQSEMWVTNPLSTSMTLNGQGGISLFSSTLGSLNAIVSFCVEIYDVPPSGSSGSLADLLAWPPTDLGGAGYVADADPNTGGNWPTAATQVSYIFNFRGSNGAVTVPAGHRVGVRVWMKAKSNTSLDLVYDNPAFPAQVQLNSQ